MRRKPFPWHITVFLAPAVVVYTVFMIYPMLASLKFSLYQTAEGGRQVFVGLGNYVRLLTDPIWNEPFWNAFWNNVVFFVIHMTLQNPIGLFLAVLLAANIRGAWIYRTIIFTPTILSVVLIGFAWKLILSPTWGIWFPLLDRLGLGDNEVAIALLGNESSALITLSLISVWQNIGIPMMLFLAALIRIPHELIEAAQVDGAGSWRIFWRIQFPLIVPTVGIVAILTFIGNFNAFDLIYATQGALAGPDFSTDIMGTFFFRTFFGFQLRPGDPNMGATVAGMMLLIILVGVLLYLYGWQRRMEEVQF
ncbi:carbohydrate ABC transporter permease [Oceanithermus desulfurans]|uniref:ABC transporter permease n=2 Tax=Oceanithermus desulfurans TaxID=227924 RepID=A0A511RKF4_9DEIN|nr:sugar ABC transporter permease [Oceanithermus desulfurans]MBB6029736.1 raffinose/stachyose/melibiose transport system permease protein [Oceanithermus desulfurans]GEM89567.1 ABC transporter permease [Oceanithermus desulfurans NBRC 100063]